MLIPWKEKLTDELCRYEGTCLLLCPTREHGHYLCHPTEQTLTIDLACSDPTACCPLVISPLSECIAGTTGRLLTFLVEGDGFSYCSTYGNIFAIQVIAHAPFLVNDIRSEQVLPSDVSTCPPI